MALGVPRAITAIINTILISISNKPYEYRNTDYRADIPCMTAMVFFNVIIWLKIYIREARNPIQSNFSRTNSHRYLWTGHIPPFYTLSPFFIFFFFFFFYFHGLEICKTAIICRCRESENGISIYISVDLCNQKTAYYCCFTYF